MKRDQIKEKYLSSATYYKSLELKESRRLLILSVLRLITIIGGLILIWIGFTASNFTGVVLALIMTILFLYLLKQFSDHSEKREFFNNLSRINQNEAEALSGNLSSFDAGSSYTDVRHDFSYDVDLFGAHSLFQYLNRTVTGYGRDILADWLSNPFILSTELTQRQNAIKELASKDRWRQEFMASGMKTTLEKGEISGLLKWFEEINEGKLSSLKIFVMFFLPAAAIVSLFLMITGILPYSVFSFIFLINLLIIAIGIRRTNEIHNALSSKYNFLSSMKGLLIMFENESFASPYLNEIKLNISGKKTSSSFAVRKLGRLIQAFDNRMNMFAGFFLNGLFLWDYHCIYRLEKWKSEYRTLFPLWLEMIGKVDAYISLGNYDFNNPGFAFPEISDNLNVFAAKNLGHQLIDETLYEHADNRFSFRQ
jgi:MutS domain III